MSKIRLLRKTKNKSVKNIPNTNEKKAVIIYLKMEIKEKHTS